jgi:hypothetical protein
MKKKKVFISIIFVAIVGGAWFGYGEYKRKVKDLAKVTARVTMPANELIAVFENNEKAANAEYLDKVIAVKGRVKALEKNDRGHFTIVLGETGSMSSVRCSMDSSHLKEVTGVKAGTDITVKGACTGFTADESLGSDVILNRCVLETEK